MMISARNSSIGGSTSRYRATNAKKDFDEQMDLIQNRYLKQIEKLDNSKEALEGFWWAKEKKIG